MSTTLRSELLKITTVRTTTWFFAATAGFVLLAVTFQAVAAGGEFLGPLEDQATQHALFTAGGVATVITVVFGALGISGEFRHRTIVPSLLVVPERVRIVGAKAVAATLGGAAIGLIAVLAAVAATAVALAVTSTPFDSDLGTLAGAWGGTVAASGLGGLLGLGIGGLARNQALAVGAVLLLLLALEPLLGSLVPDLAPWLPARLATTISDPGSATDPSVGAAAALYAAYGLLAAAGAAVVLRRTDVS